MKTMADSFRALPASDINLRLLTGQTLSFASTFDQRFSFSLYVPKSHSFDGPELPLLVIIHGTRRRTERYLSQPKDFSEKHNCVVFCPLFPAGIIDPCDIHNYKAILYNDIRFDKVLLSMIEQASSIWRIRTNTFHMHGFSGGGQFAHRFFYLYPDRLASVSIGAPGQITSPDSRLPWPAGISNISDKFSITGIPNFETMAQVPVQMVVGAEDLDTSLLKEIESIDSDGQKIGNTRVDRIMWLRNAWKENGMSVELAIVPNVAHNGLKCLPAVTDWLGQWIGSV